jgi:hypothetical protein
MLIKLFYFNYYISGNYRYKEQYSIFLFKSLTFTRKKNFDITSAFEEH